VIKIFKRLKNKIRLFFERFAWFRTFENEFAPFTVLTLLGSGIINLAILILNLAYSLYYSSPWYFTFSLYYLMLFIARVIALIRTYRIIKQSGDEKEFCLLRMYRLHLAVGIPAFFMSLLIGGILYVILQLSPPQTKSLIPAITSATYTFYKMVNSIRGILKARKDKEHIALTTFRDIGIIDAIASMLMLEVTMIYANGEFDGDMKTVVFISGICFAVLAVVISLIMVFRGARYLANNKKTVQEQ